MNIIGQIVHKCVRYKVGALLSIAFIVREREPERNSRTQLNKISNLILKMKFFSEAKEYCVNFNILKIVMFCIHKQSYFYIINHESRVVEKILSKLYFTHWTENIWNRKYREFLQQHF